MKKKYFKSLTVDFNNNACSWQVSDKNTPITQFETETDAIQFRDMLLRDTLITVDDVERPINVVAIDSHIRSAYPEVNSSDRLNVTKEVKFRMDGLDLFSDLWKGKQAEEVYTDACMSYVKDGRSFEELYEEIDDLEIFNYV